MIRIVAKDKLFWLFERPQKLVQAHTWEESLKALEEIEELVESRGWYAVGYVAYEEGDRPLLDFGLYGPPRSLTQREVLERFPERPFLSPLKTDRSFENYCGKIAAIKSHLEKGNTYQVNFTFPWSTKILSSAPAEEAWRGLFASSLEAASGDYPAYMETENLNILSLSPELFFEKKGSRLRCRPMKGTLNVQEPAQKLADSPKDRAENLMILDMIRNDLGQISRIGSVRTTKLFEVETYPTVHQMVSEVESDSDLSLSALFQALFPCASITGAPKVRTMEIIKEVEEDPRGVYTGALGWIAPGGQALFSVAIRTLTGPVAQKEAQYWTGGGIVWDSEPDREWAEAALKTQVLHRFYRPFDLLESLLWDGQELVLASLHWDRMDRALTLLGEPLLNREVLAQKLEPLMDSNPAKIRVLLTPSGELKVEKGGLSPKNLPLRLALALRPAPTEDLPYRIKTTYRTAYEPFLNEIPEADEVVLFNRKGELTEGTFSNLALKIGDQWWTPSLSSGLLAGTWREKLLSEGFLREKVLTRADFYQAQEVALINSVRGWMPAVRIG